jgi:hypothetical protein
MKRPCPNRGCQWEGQTFRCENCHDEVCWCEGGSHAIELCAECWSELGHASCPTDADDECPGPVVASLAVLRLRGAA